MLTNPYFFKHLHVHTIHGLLAHLNFFDKLRNILALYLAMRRSTASKKLITIESDSDDDENPELREETIYQCFENEDFVPNISSNNPESDEENAHISKNTPQKISRKRPAPSPNSAFRTPVKSPKLFSSSAPRLSTGFSSTLNNRPLSYSAVGLRKPFKIPTFTDPERSQNIVFRAGTTLGIRRKIPGLKGPLHDPEDDNAIILFEPANPMSAAALLFGTDCMKSDKDKKHEVHVIVDPILSKVLRPHQIEGVRFLYDCTTGSKVDNAFGCVMADEMGLGKTLQCITLLWTLLKQSPEPGKPTIEKAIIACPSSLVRNWANELKKWLGPDRVRPLACDGKSSKEAMTKDLQQFGTSKGRTVINPVLIISYESLRAYAGCLQNSEIGLLLCDEGHRLKNSESQTYVALNALNAKRRVILSGTPIQNDLTEYFSLISFAIPDALGSGAEFRKKYENPILRGRDSLATDREREISEERLTELLLIANKFIIRRTADLLTKYREHIPVKYEHVVFVKLTDLQLELYRKYIASKEIKRLLNEEAKKLSGGTSNPGGGGGALKAITYLRKLCNHPALLAVNEESTSTGKSSTRGFGNSGNTSKLKENLGLPPELDIDGCQPEFAGKMLLLQRMLETMR
ncbi:DNA-dependent ATPase protein rad54 [Nowakowskiella sp. JEL0078]|nr:DNA-dependent ATPase protein rad54 [Nowakowskiella sp. JEL0078]